MGTELGTVLRYIVIAIQERNSFIASWEMLFAGYASEDACLEFKNCIQLHYGTRLGL